MRFLLSCAKEFAHMPRPIDSRTAADVLREVYTCVVKEEYDPSWVPLIEEVWTFAAKTWVPALGTVLLAKSVDSQVDVGSIKVLNDNENPNTFSLRSLGHGVLVPMSRELNFSLRVTGREPLNNQPFFRYDHVDNIDRVKNLKELDRYKEIIYHKLAPVKSTEARRALAAFIYISIREQKKSDTIAKASGGLTRSEIMQGIHDLLSLPGAGPSVVQALGAILLGRVSPTVVTRRVHDPSRDFPGDVQGLEPNGSPTVALEARNKTVSESDASIFAAECARSQIPRAIILEITGKPSRLLSSQVAPEIWQRFGVSLIVIDNINDYLTLTSILGVEEPWLFYQGFAEDLSGRLAEVDAPAEVRVKWATYVASLQ